MAVYEKPRLVCHGSIAALTRQTTSGATLDRTFEAGLPESVVDTLAPISLS